MIFWGATPSYRIALQNVGLFGQHKILAALSCINNAWVKMPTVANAQKALYVAKRWTKML